MTTLSRFLAMDRRQAVARGLDLPDHATGSALLADLSGFTRLTDAFTQALGPQRGAEEFGQVLSAVYDALVAEVHAQRGSVIGFSGDAITAWFDESAAALGLAGAAKPYAPAALRAVSCALALQRVMAAFSQVPLPGGGTTALGLKVAVATGPARRFVAGDPAIRLYDVLAGATLERLGLLEPRVQPGEIVLDPATWEALRPPGEQAANLDGAWLCAPGELGKPGREGFVLSGLADLAPAQPWPALPPDALTDEQIRPWLLPAVWARLQSGQGAFLTELRPAVALFVRFGGIDYERPSAGPRLNAYIRWVQRVLARYDGALMTLTLGDKGAYYYASFGAPTAHGDDAARAVQTALELRTPPDECRFIRGLQLGLSQGLICAGAYGGQDGQAYDTVGDSVNLAARLMQAAAPGGILATPEVYQATEARFQWAALPPLAVKGKRAPVPVYGLVEQVTGPERALLEPVYRTPIIGRAAELAVIAERLAQARAGQGQIVALTAQAGVGKSRLVAEAVRHARAAGFKVYGGAAQSYGTHTPYLAWHPIWQAFFDLELGAPVDELVMQLEQALTVLVPERLPRLPVLGPALGLALPDNALTAGFDAQLRKESLAALLIDCVRARAAHTPLVFVLEDCHWLDPLAHDLLEALGRASATLPVMLVLAYRPPDIERLQAPRVTALPHGTELRLEPFKPEEARALVYARLGPDLPAETLAALTQRAEGNPFYLEEFMNYLLERGVDARDAAAVAQLDWPVSLQRLLLARIDQLTEPQRTVLKVASIVGRRFQFRQLWGVYPPLGATDAVYGDLMQLDDLDLTRLDTPGEPRRDAPALAYLFKHIVTQEVAYASLPRALRAQLHEQFAAWLEAGSAAANTPPPLDLLAYHYSQGTHVAKQREYLRKAGEAAAAAYANEAALDYLSRALALTPEDALAERYALLRQREQVYELQGARQAQAEDLQALERLAGQLDACDTAPARQAEVAVRRAQYAEALGDYGQAIAQSRQAIALAEAASAAGAAGAVAFQVHGYLAWGSTLWHQGEYPAAREVLEQGLTLAHAARLADPEADCLRSLGVVFDMQGDYVQARHYFEQAQQALEPARHNLRHEARVLNSLGIVTMNQGDYAAAQGYFAEALRIRHEVGDRYGAGTTTNNLGLLAWQQGDYPAAQRFFEQALRLCRELADREGEAGALAGLGLIVLQLGDLKGARSALPQAAGMAHEIGDVSGEAEVLSAVGLLHLYSGNAAEAARYGQLALDLARPVKAHNAEGEAWVVVGHAALAQGRLAEAEEAYRQGAAIRQSVGQAHRALESLAGLARIARARGAADQALAYVETILPHLLPGRLDGTAEPFSVYLTCYQVLADCGDSRAAHLLAQARHELETQVERMEGTHRRQAFIASVAARRELAALFPLT